MNSLLSSVLLLETIAGDSVGDSRWRQSLEPVQSQSVESGA